MYIIFLFTGIYVTIVVYTINYYISILLEAMTNHGIQKTIFVKFSF